MQRHFNFIGALEAPKNAPLSIISQITDAAQAVRVAFMQKGLKAAYYAEQMHISESYFSRIANGHRDIPGWFIEPFCTLSGSNLLKQFLALQEAIKAAEGKLYAKAVERHLAEQIRDAA